ncbi:hypothetical protein ATR1_315d0001, partial [Acetobacter tropicalis]
REFSLIETVNALRGDLTVRTHGTSLSQTGFNLHPTVQRSDTTNDERPGKIKRPMT